MTTNGNLLDRAKQVIPLASQTLSKSYVRYPAGMDNFAQYSRGSKLVTVGGKELIDFSAALGSVILGHAEWSIEHSVSRVLMDVGVAHSLPTGHEVLLAEKLVEIIPCAEMVRFLKNGSDATTAALKVARAFTGKSIIYSNGYHGWHDWCVSDDGDKNGGVVSFSPGIKHFKNYDQLENDISYWSPSHVAGVIVDTMHFPIADLRKLRKLCDDSGILLIFDEILTGFRLALGGMQEFIGVVPDLACFGKAMGNGYPISALVGRRDIMKVLEKNTFVSSTFGGDLVGITAAWYTIKQLEKRKTPVSLDNKGRTFKQKANILLKDMHKKYFELTGYNQMLTMNFLNDKPFQAKAKFIKGMYDEGIFTYGNFNLMEAHSEEDMQKTLGALYMVLSSVYYDIENDNLGDEKLREVR